MKFLIMQSSPASRHFHRLRSKYSPQHPVIRHPLSVFVLIVRDPLSRPYKTADEAENTCFLIFLISGKLMKRISCVYYIKSFSFTIFFLPAFLVLLRRPYKV